MERADKGLLVAITLDDGLKDGIAVLLILVGDMVNGALDSLHALRVSGTFLIGDSR